MTQESAELDLERERHKMGHSHTVQELQSMIAVLEREAENNRGSALKRQALLSDVEAAKTELRSIIARFEVKTSLCKAATPQKTAVLYRQHTLHVFG